MTRSLEDRFMDGKFVYDESGCWLWIAHKNDHGYGIIKTSGTHNRKLLRAHRVAYEMFVGPIPEGLELDHLCRVRHCVNPDHLEPVTTRENLLRGETLTARWAKRTHCDEGHPFDEPNTRITPQGWRVCRICANEAAKRAYRRRRQREQEQAA